MGAQPKRVQGSWQGHAACAQAVEPVPRMFWTLFHKGVMTL